MAKSTTGPAAVRIFPMPVAPFVGVPHKVQDVTPAEAAVLTRYGQFVTDPALLPAGHQPFDPDGLMPPSAEGTGPAGVPGTNRPSEE